jgi:HEPN domain-containing protein
MYKELPCNFLEIAQSDLRAAKCLFENCFYPQSLFFLQQSVEKATKAFSIKVGLLKNEKEIKSYSHKSSTIFIDCIKKVLNSSDQLDQLKNTFNNYSEGQLSKEDDEEIIKMIISIQNSEIKHSFDSSNILYLYLYLLSMLLTSKVNENTRYPDFTKNYLPSMNYNKNSLLVKSFTELSNVIEEALDILKECLESSECENSFEICKQL